jgi:hypothetical protein
VLIDIHNLTTSTASPRRIDPQKHRSHGDRAALSAGSHGRQFLPGSPVPVCYFPYYFLAYMLVGVAWLAILHRRDRTALSAIEADLDATVDAHDHPAPESTITRADSTAKSPVTQP